MTNSVDPDLLQQYADTQPDPLLAQAMIRPPPNAPKPPPPPQTGTAVAVGEPDLLQKYGQMRGWVPAAPGQLDTLDQGGGQPQVAPGNALGVPAPQQQKYSMEIGPLTVTHPSDEARQKAADDLAKKLSSGDITVQDYAKKVSALDLGNANAGAVTPGYIAPQREQTMQHAAPPPAVRQGTTSVIHAGTPEGDALARQLRAQGYGADEDETEQPPPPPPQPTIIPEQWRRTISPEDVSEEERLAGQRVVSTNQAEQRRAQAQQAMQQGLADRTAYFQGQQQAQADEIKRLELARDNARQDFDVADKLAQQAKIDPQRFWHDRGTGSHILASLGVALGAFGSALTHTPNTAMEIVNHAIDNDIKAQEADMAQKNRTRETALQRLREQTGDLTSAKALYRDAALQAVQSKLGELGGGQQAAELANLAQQQRDQIRAGHLDFRIKTTQHIPAQVVGMPAQGGAEGSSENGFMLPEEMGGFPANTRLIATGKKSAEDLRNVAVANGVIQEMARKVAAIEAANPYDIYRPGSKARVDAEAEIKAALGKVGALQGQNKLPIVDVEMWKDQLLPHGMMDNLGAATGASATISDRAQSMARVADREAGITFRTHAVEQARRHLTVDQRGQVTPGVHYTGEDVEKKPMPKSFRVQLPANVAPERAPLQYQPEIRHVITTPGKGKGKPTETRTVTEPEEDDEGE